MAEKKSFVLYADMENIIEVLSYEERGRLLTAVFAYFSRGEQPDFDGALKAVFVMIAQQLDRDREKWEEICRKRSEYASRGGKAKAAKRQVMLPKVADTDNDTVTDTVTVTENETENDNVIVTENGNESESENDTVTSSCAYAPAPAPKTNNNIIILSNDDRERLYHRYGRELTDEYISRVENYCKDTGKHYSDPASTIAKWIEQDKAKGYIRDEQEHYHQPEMPRCERRRTSSYGFDDNSENPSYSIDEWYATTDSRLDAFAAELERAAADNKGR
jgi:hypothetical protein